MMPPPTCPVKQSQALRGRNLIRDSQADGVPMDSVATNKPRPPGHSIGHQSHALKNPRAWDGVPAKVIQFPLNTTENERTEKNDWMKKIKLVIRRVNTERQPLQRKIDLHS